MIIYYKSTGQVVGAIFGRVHDESVLAIEKVMDGETLNKIVCEWKDFTPSIQPELFFELDKDPSKIYEYEVDIETKLLRKK